MPQRRLPEMKKIALGQTIGILANVGVIAGIVFLALELRQNTDLMRAQSRTEMSQTTGQLLTMDVNDRTYVETMYRGFRGEELDEIEKEQLFRTLSAWVYHWNNIAYLHDAGLYDDAEFDLQITHIRDELEYLPGWKA